MTRALLAKELRALRMYALLIVGYVLLEFMYVCVTEFPDMKPLVAQDHMSGDRSEIIAFSVIFGSLIGAFVLGQEREHSTQSFLDGLPVRRWHVFGVKAAAAFLVSLVWPLSHLALRVGVGLMSLNSITEPIHWPYIGAVSLSGAALMLTVTGVALALSFLRQWFALGAGLAVWAVVWLRINAPERITWFNTTELFTFGLPKDHTVIMPWHPIIAHAGVGLAAILIAGCAYAWRDGWWSRWMQRIGQWRFINWLRMLAPLGAVAVWISLFVMIEKDDVSEPHEATKDAAGTASTKSAKPEATHKAKAADFDAFDSTKTRHYEFIFRKSQSERFQRFQPYVELLHDEAASFFGSPPAPPERIVVDLASSVMSHAAGQTNWTKVRMPLMDDETVDEWRRILRHETAHVYIEQLSDGAATSHFDSMRAFHEGAATAAEFSASDEASIRSARQDMELWAALAHSRGEISLDLLCDNNRLSAHRDTFLVYPLGYIFTRALIRAGGKEAPRRLMETLRDSPPAPGAKGVEVWRHLTQRCGISWERVLADYRDELKTLTKANAKTIAKLPRIKAEVKVERDSIVIHPLLEVTVVPARLRCRIEVDRGVMQEPVSVPMDAKGDFRLQRSTHPGTHLRYMLGWHLGKGHAAADEPWVEALLK